MCRGAAVMLGSMAADLGIITWCWTQDYFNATHLGFTLTCLALGVGTTALSQLSDTKSEAINRRSANLACQGLSHALWDKHRLSVQISSVRLKTR